MSSPRVVYASCPDATSESEANALADVYRFLIFDCYAKKKATRPGGPDDTEELKNDRTAEPKYKR